MQVRLIYIANKEIDIGYGYDNSGLKINIYYLIYIIGPEKTTIKSKNSDNSNKITLQETQIPKKKGYQI